MLVRTAVPLRAVALQERLAGRPIGIKPEAILSLEEVGECEVVVRLR